MVNVYLMAGFAFILAAIVAVGGFKMVRWDLDRIFEEMDAQELPDRAVRLYLKGVEYAPVFVEALAQDEDDETQPLIGVAKMIVLEKGDERVQRYDPIHVGKALDRKTAPGMRAALAEVTRDNFVYSREGAWCLYNPSNYDHRLCAEEFVMEIQAKRAVASGFRTRAFFLG